MYICIILCISNTVLIYAVINIMCHPYTYSGDLPVPPNGGLSLHISGLCQSSEVHLLHPECHALQRLHMVPSGLLL